MQVFLIQFRNVRNVVPTKHGVVVPALEPHAFPLRSREFRFHACPVMVKVSRRIAIVSIERYVVLNRSRIPDFSGELREWIYPNILAPYIAIFAFAQHLCNSSVGKAFLRSQGAPELPFR